MKSEHKTIREIEKSAYEAMKVMELFTKHSVSYTGVTQITMSRGVGWDFMNFGKYFERSEGGSHGVPTLQTTVRDLNWSYPTNPCP